VTILTAPGSSTRILRAGAHDIAVLVTAVTVLAMSGRDMPDWSSVIPYLAVLFMLSLMDVQLPHGDSVDIDSAVIIASVYLFGPVAATWLVFISRILAHMALHGFSLHWGLASSIAKRIVGISAGFAVLWLVPPPAWERAQIFVEVLALGLVYVAAGLLYSQVTPAAERRDSILRMAAGSVALQGPVLASGVSVAILTVLIHDEMTVWGLVLVLFLALTTRQSFALLLDVRQGYQTTVEALVGAMEAQKSHEPGVGSEVAIMARTAGAAYGWFGKPVENMGYAALLLYFGLSFTSRDDSVASVRPTPLAEVRFLRPVAPIVEAAQRPPGQVPVPRRTLIAAYITALCVSRLSPARADTMVANLAGQLTPKERWRSEAAVEHAARQADAS